ncbi:MAG TPA: protein kinase, partial [Kofleriaceae bacterium]
HANIAQIFDLGVVEGAYYIALEHVHGRDLRGIFDRCRQLGDTMAVAQACFLAMKVCEGLDYAHNKRDQGRPLQLVHRDVSPQNILVSFEGEVKLIDFGVAKAASNGTPTQAGILKGKFGYMSPEQVRGLPVDRRSDVFSCGIVLYELLTGERLFVGESDFSTLEKVRNVEILPPSTYNRKIPDELERIVLKALAKDVEDRYQNAIDLHDELQAFVYTAGEFYSRKDLAGWMKKTFVQEIEEELAKLESFRELKPPGPGGADSPVITQRSSIQKSSATRKPSPTVPPPVVKPPPPPTLGRSAVPIAPVAISASAPVSSPTATPPAALPVVGSSRVAARPHRPGPSSWDDDDLETRVFDEDNDRHNKSQRANLPLQAPPVSSPPASVLAPPPEPGPPEHLLPQTGEVPSWNSADLAASPTMGQATLRGAVGMLNHPGASGPHAAPPVSGPHLAPHVAQHVSGAHAIPQAVIGGDGLSGDSRPNRRRGESVPPVNREISAPQRLVAVPQEVVSEPSSEPLHHPVTEFGARIAERRVADRRRSILVLVIGSAAIATISIIFAILLSGPKKPAAPAPVAGDKPPVAMPLPAAAAADPSTGFDLYVSPAGVAQWRLDGELRTDRLPSRIRGISPGPHTVQIDPPPGFMSQNQQIGVEQGKAPKVEIVLQPINGITGTFESTPPGAQVSLIIDGKRQPLGPAPAKSPLDPRSSYQVLFEKPGYVSVNRPIVFSGGLEERVVVVLEKDESPPP